MAAFLALLSAVGYGAGDFLGGVAARRMPAPAVVWRSNMVGLAGLLMALPLVGADEVAARDVVVGAVAGVAGGIGILLLYRGLAAGAMGLVAPVTAMLAALVPVAAGLVGGERLSPGALAGVVLAVAAVALLSGGRDGTPAAARMSRPLLLTALGAGLGFGLFFVGLDATGDDAGLWPIVAGRSASVLLFSVVVALSLTSRTGFAVRAERRSALLLVGCGLLDASANALFLVATQLGALTVVAVLGALYPVSTVLLARVVLSERLDWPQLAGCALAATAVVLVTAA